MASAARSATMNKYGWAFLAHSRAPFSVEDDARVCEPRAHESLGDWPHLITEDTGENQPPARSGYSGNT
jgi:hypothetical protein